MSKYSIISWTLGMIVVAIVGANYLYSSSNQSIADTQGDVQTTINLDQPTTLNPPDPTGGSTGQGTATTTPDTTTANPDTASTTAGDAASTAPDTTSTIPSDGTSSTGSTATTPGTGSSSSSTTAKPSATSSPSTTSTPATDVASVSGSSIIKTATEIKAIVTNSLVMRRAVSADKSRDSITVQFTLPNAGVPVTLMVQSDPIVVHTTSDNNGKVIYEITDPLKPGDHTLTISITDPKDPAKIISVIKPFTLPAISTSSDLNTSPNLITKERIVIPIQYLFALILSILVTSAVSYAIYHRHSLHDTDLALEG